MKRIITPIVLILLLSQLSQAKIVSDTLIVVEGNIVNKESNEPVSATITYEKLPYYDDMGIARSASSGHYRLHLVKNHQYNIHIKADGYKPVSQDLLVSVYDGSMKISKDFQLEADEGAEDEKIDLKNLIFARGRSAIASSSFEELDNLVRWMEDHPDASIQLEGHTDFEGNAAANLKLSLDRVESVKDYLTDKGVQKKRVLTKAFGGTQPLTRDRTDEGKARNRRVEVRVIRDN
ncbi:MAG: OmpA family protein [Cyclobacteriaceae bacterium]